MSDFGDLTDDDAVDTEPADPEQVAIKLHAIRRSDGFESVDWDTLTQTHRARLITVAVALIAWWRLQGLR